MTTSWLSYCKSFIPRLKQQHLNWLGRPCCIETPSRFSDKLEWLKIYDSTFLKTYCADKITVRKYVHKKLGKDISIPLIGTYTTFDQIDFTALPSDYVIKTNHASHTNTIVTDGNIDRKSAKKFYDMQLHRDYSEFAFEMFYKLIPPKIIIEPLMTDGHTDLTDYKFYCFNGKPHFCQVIANRSSNETMSHYTDGWIYNAAYDQVGHTSDPHIPKPYTYDQMYQYATILSSDFKFVRVDFYEIEGQCYFGELTFIPAAAYIQYKTDSTDYMLGNLLTL